MRGKWSEKMRKGSGVKARGRGGREEENGWRIRWRAASGAASALLRSSLICHFILQRPRGEERIALISKEDKSSPRGGKRRGQGREDKKNKKNREIYLFKITAAAGLFTHLFIKPYASPTPSGGGKEGEKVRAFCLRPL